MIESNELELQQSAAVWADWPELRVSPSPDSADLPGVSVFGVRTVNVSMTDAIDLMESLIQTDREQAATLYFINANTLNHAYEDPAYRDLLNRATYVFNDGTGVRWASRLQGVRLKANLNGTDMIPAFFTATVDRGYTYYMLGSSTSSLERAVKAFQRKFPGWTLVGHHDGYLDGEQTTSVIEEINALQPHVLLIGMGNPIQERWIEKYKHQLRVRLAVGVGGLFNHMCGDIKRPPAWVRYLGYEWLLIMLQQPHKSRRYLLGNPVYLWRVFKSWLNNTHGPVS